MPALGTPELILILTVIILLFGVGRISRLGKEFGQGIHEFRQSLKGEGEK
ncbi:MAG: twin-arginine translocase TatA/TatE family subunit [Anaerolineae bacterium]|nr:MAG: twin-arginine translocase TatA/TatE family subunit [Anaerolineae bacterium]